MSVAISAVPVVSNDAQAAPLTAEQPLSEFVGQMQDSALSGMPHAANPAALAAELVGTLRTYFDRAQRFEKGIGPDWSANSDGGTDAMSALPTSEVAPQLHGGPAREPLDSNSRVSPAVTVDLAQLQRTMDVALASMSFSTKTALVVRGTSQISHSANTLLKGQ
jgi:hypothetical protein